VYKLCRIDIDHSKEIIEQLKKFVNEIKRKLPITEVYLYGSFANGKIHEGSDIDLIIIGDFKERFFERIGKIFELTDLLIEPIVYTPQEFKELQESENPFIVEVLKKAIKL